MKKDLPPDQFKYNELIIYIFSFVIINLTLIWTLQGSM